MKEKLIIDNFAGIKNLEIDIEDINIFIGPQASGKSVIAKLLYYFKSYIEELAFPEKYDFDDRVFIDNRKRTFENYFPLKYIGSGNFMIKYILGQNEMKITKENSSPHYYYSEEFQEFFLSHFKKAEEAFEKAKEKSSIHFSREFAYLSHFQEKFEIRAGNYNFFVPTVRAYYANKESTVFSSIKENTAFDPFLVEFGSLYQNLKRVYLNKSIYFDTDDRFNEIQSEILRAVYKQKNGIDYLSHEDDRLVDILYSSTGQQEFLPILIILKTLLNSPFDKVGASLYIEEPEAHLFPTSQKRIMQLLARTYNLREKNTQYILTTHSPYILTSFNNLIEAGNQLKKYPNKSDEIFDIVPKDEIVDIGKVSAYAIDYDGAKSLIRNDTNLISADLIDDVSEEMSEEFGKLLDIS